MTTGIGIAGFGLMGRTHLNAYLADPRAEIVAVADPDTTRVELEQVESNLSGPGSTFDLRRVRHYPSLEAMLSDNAVQAVSICSPTANHVDMSIACLESGRHVLVEKPLGLTSSEAMRAVRCAEVHTGLIAMPAMCMRFWPAWRWLKETIDEGTFGRVRAATFTRLGPMPTWASFYRNADESGGAILDLHIHDTDFVRYCFGDPASVFARGYSETTHGVDHVVTHYHFPDGPSIVAAEGGWSMKPGFEFTMRYLVNFERATARFDFRSDPQLKVQRDDGGEEAVQLSPLAGYEHEVRYFLDCVENGAQPSIVTMHDAAEAVRLIEAERESVKSGRAVASFS